MEAKFTLSLGLAAVFGSAGLLQAKPAPDAQIQRGKYLVEDVAMCADCHTPRDAKGRFIRSEWLQGNILDFKPDSPRPFAAVAVPIAGLPGFTDVQAVKFFETGLDATGQPALPPMPQFRFKPADAAAVVACLRSLKK